MSETESWIIMTSNDPKYLEEMEAHSRDPSTRSFIDELNCKVSGLQPVTMEAYNVWASTCEICTRCLKSSGGAQVGDMALVSTIAAVIPSAVFLRAGFIEDEEVRELVRACGFSFAGTWLPNFASRESFDSDGSFYAMLDAIAERHFALAGRVFKYAVKALDDRLAETFSARELSESLLSHEEEYVRQVLPTGLENDLLISAVEQTLSESLNASLQVALDTRK